MCQHAAETLGELLTAELPDIKEIMTVSGNYENTPAGQTLLTELGQLGTDLSTWTPGDTATDIETVSQDVLAGFQAIPGIPANYVQLAALAEGALVIIVNTVKGNNASASGDSETAATAHANATTAAAKIGYHVNPFTIAAIQLNPKHAASEYKKQSEKIHKAIQKAA